MAETEIELGKNSYYGPLVRGQHHDHTDVATPLVKAAVREPSIVGIHFGRIENHGGQRGVTFTQEGKDRLVATIKSTRSTQVVTFYTTNREQMQTTLEKAFR